MGISCLPSSFGRQTRCGRMRQAQACKHCLAALAHRTQPRACCTASLACERPSRMCPTQRIAGTCASCAEVGRSFSQGGSQVCMRAALASATCSARHASATCPARSAERTEAGVPLEHTCFRLCTLCWYCNRSVSSCRSVPLAPLFDPPRCWCRPALPSIGAAPHNVLASWDPLAQTWLTHGLCSGQHNT